MIERHLFRSALLAAGFAISACGIAWGTVHAPTVQLHELEAWARASAPSARLAQAEKDLAGRRAETIRTNQGARIFGGASLGDAREATTDTTHRTYQRAQLQAGVRWPLLGTREAQLRTVTQADQATAARQIQLIAAQQDAILSVRKAYLRHRYSTERVALTQAYLSERSSIEQSLAKRQKAGYMLEAERLTLAQLFESAAAIQAAQQSRAQNALKELTLLSNRAVDALATEPIHWPKTCTTADSLYGGSDDHPSIVQARQALEAVDQTARHARRETVEAGVSVSQSLSKDLGGQSGRSTWVGVDISMPLDWRAHRDALLGQLQSERFRAEQLLDLRRSEFIAATDQAIAALQLRNADTGNARRQLQIAQENLRVFALRQQRLEDGDALAKVLGARHALLQAGLQWIDAMEQQDFASADLASWSNGGCPQAHTVTTSASALQPFTLALMANPLNMNAEAQAPQGHTTQRTDSAIDSRHLGWYVWDGLTLLQTPRPLERFPAGTHRVLLSFTAPQLVNLIQGPAHQQLRRFVRQAHANGIKVELLLGEPTWVLPTGRTHLIELLKQVRQLPFDALHLDLERSQLPEAEQPLWDDGVLAAVRAARAVTPWPLALTTHYRELESDGFIVRLKDAGASEITAMVYVSNVERSAGVLRALWRDTAGMKLSVAQSIEPSLPAEESSFSLGQSSSRKRWKSLAHALADVPGFNGVIVQSWEDFTKARP